MVEIQPKMKHPSRNFFKRVEAYLPWDDFEVGCSFFIPTASVEKDAKALKQTAHRRGFSVVVEDSHEAEGRGVRVRRVG